MTSRHMVSIALSDEEIDILARVQNITLNNPKDTIMLGVMCVLFIHDHIDKARERARK